MSYSSHHPRPLQGAFSFNGMFARHGGVDWEHATSFHFVESQLVWNRGDFANLRTDFFSSAGVLTHPVPILEFCTFMEDATPARTGSVDIEFLSYFVPPGLFFAEGQAIVRYAGFDDTLASWSICASPRPDLEGNYWATAVVTAWGVKSLLASGSFAQTVSASVANEQMSP